MPRHGSPLLERALRPPHPPLAVHHERQLIVAPGDPAVGAQLPQGERVILHRVGRDREGLPHHADPAGATRRRDRVLVRQRRILVDQPGRHHQMLGHALGVLFTQCLQLIARDAIQFAGFHAVRDDRVVVSRSHRPRAERVAVLGRLALPGAGIVACGLAVSGPQALLALSARRLAIATRRLPITTSLTITARSLVIPARRLAIAAWSLVVSALSLAIAVRLSVAARSAGGGGPPLGGPGVLVTRGGSGAGRATSGARTSLALTRFAHDRVLSSTTR